MRSTGSIGSVGPTGSKPRQVQVLLLPKSVLSGTWIDWMFLSSFQAMRERLLREKTVRTMAHLGARAFGSISGEVVQVTACVLQNRPPHGYKPTFFRLLDGGEEEKRTALSEGKGCFDSNSQDEFNKIPGGPIAYWISDQVLKTFIDNPLLGEITNPLVGLQTGNNELCRANHQSHRYHNKIKWSTFYRLDFFLLHSCFSVSYATDFRLQHLDVLIES